MIRERLPAINVIEHPLGLALAIRGEVDIVLDPSDEVIFECTLDQLMEEIGSQELVDVRPREMMREWLKMRIFNWWTTTGVIHLP